MLPMFLLVTMTGSALIVPADDPATRLGIALALVLTVVAFKFTISGYVPKIAYNTLLDTYNFFSFFFLALFILLIVIVPYVSSKVEIILTAVLCGAWFLGNIVFVVKVAHYLNKTYSKMEALEKLHKESNFLHNMDDSDYKNLLEPEWHLLDFDKLAHSNNNNNIGLHPANSMES